MTPLFFLGSHVFFGPWENLINDVYINLDQDALCQFPKSNIRRSSDIFLTDHTGFVYRKDMAHQELLTLDMLRLVESRTNWPPRQELKKFGVESPHKIGHDCVGNVDDVEDILDQCKENTMAKNTLALEHVQQIFIIYIAGNLLSLLSFFLELCRAKLIE